MSLPNSVSSGDLRAQFVFWSEGQSNTAICEDCMKKTEIHHGITWAHRTPIARKECSRCDPYAVAVLSMDRWLILRKARLGCASEGATKHSFYTLSESAAAAWDRNHSQAAKKRD
jgi:hypothetical protein